MGLTNPYDNESGVKTPASLPARDWAAAAADRRSRENGREDDLPGPPVLAVHRLGDPSRLYWSFTAWATRSRYSAASLAIIP